MKNNEAILEICSGVREEKMSGNEKKMRFSQKISNILMRTAQACLFASALMFGCVHGDVFQLQNAAGNVTATPPGTGGANDFDAFIAGNPNGLPAGAIDPFIAVAQQPQQWQMLGYAVFFPNGVAEAQQVYVAKKRPPTFLNNEAVPAAMVQAPFVAALPLVANNANAAAIAAHGGSFNALLSVDATSHTERQLVVHLLTSLPAHVGIINPAGAGGDLYVYTEQQPCLNRVSDNAMFSCIEYYMNLARVYPNVNFHIYCPNNVMSLNVDFICNPTPNQTVNVNDDHRAAFVLMNLVAGSIINGYPTFTNNGIRMVSLIGGGTHLLQCRDGNKWIDVASINALPVAAIIGGTGLHAVVGAWRNPDGTPWNQGAARQRLTILVNLMNSPPVLPAMPPLDRGAIFSRIFNFANVANIAYHSI
jgi:hypothetical protein